MSNDPSPWADKPYDPLILDSTEEMLKLAEDESFQEERERAMNDKLWAALANRMTRDGGLIR